MFWILAWEVRKSQGLPPFIVKFIYLSKIMPITVFLYTIFYVDNLCRYFGNIISISFVVNFSQKQKDKENMKFISKYMCELKCWKYRNHFGLKLLWIKFLAHLAKGNMSFCHHLASVVRRLSSVNFSHFNLLLWNLSAKWSETWKVLSKTCSFCPDPLTNMAAIGILCFWLTYFFKSSPLKPLDQINWNLVGSIYGMSSIKIANFVPIR